MHVCCNIPMQQDTFDARHVWVADLLGGVTASRGFEATDDVDKEVKELLQVLWVVARLQPRPDEILHQGTQSLL